MSSLSEPTAIAFDPSGNLFVCLKGGTILVRSGGVTGTVGFINVSTQSERGLLGLAFDPDYATSGHIFVYYTTNASSLNFSGTASNRVSRFTISGNQFVPGSEAIIVDNIPSTAGNHNGGCVRFGQDGMLYVSTGDGGSSPSNSQTLSNLAGKILRVTKLGAIPGDNPFVGTAGARGEIYCLGLRNPYKFNFRPGTNILYIGDVGSTQWEELNICSAGGQNFGWPIHEGLDGGDPATVDPVYAYAHTPGNPGVITGGCFVTGTNYPAKYQGSYCFGDFLRGNVAWVRMSATDTVSTTEDTGNLNGYPVDFAMGTDGNMYYADYGFGTVNRLDFAAAALASLTTTPTHVASGRPVYGRVNLVAAAPTGGVTVNLSDNSDSLDTPSSVFVPAGASTATFVVNTSPVPSQANRLITATSGSSSKSATVALLPSGVKTLTLDPTSVQGGSSSIGTVTLSFPAVAAGATVTLTDNSSAITTPGSMSIAGGASSGTFTVNTSPVTATYNRTISASYNAVMRTAILTLTP